MDVSIHELARRAIKAAGLRFDETEGFPALRFGVTGENGRWICQTRFDTKTRVLTFYSICPLRADGPRKEAVNELVTRANFALPIGSFELDLDGGEIRFRTSIDAQPVESAGAESLGQSMVESAMFANIRAMDAYLPAIASVIEHEIDPKDALAKVGDPKLHP
jgi:hypothetical protein